MDLLVLIHSDWKLALLYIGRCLHRLFELKQFKPERWKFLPFICLVGKHFVVGFDHSFVGVRIWVWRLYHSSSDSRSWLSRLLCSTTWHWYHSCCSWSNEMVKIKNLLVLQVVPLTNHSSSDLEHSKELKNEEKEVLC